MSYQITGVTRDNTGNLTGSCDVFLLKYNSGTHTFTQIAHTTSGAGDGSFTFSGLADNDPSYNIVAFKDGTPHIFDISDRNIQPVVGGLTPVFWLDASVGASVHTSGTTPNIICTQWDDQSASGYNLTQANAGYRWGCDAASMQKNGIPVMYTSYNSYNCMYNTSVNQAQPFTMFWVVRNDNVSTLGIICDSTTANNRVAAFVSASNFYLSAGADLQGSFTFVNGSWYVVTGVFNGASSAIYINGTLDIGGDAGTRAFVSGDGGMLIGERYSYPTPSYTWMGGIAEIQMYAGALNATEISNIVGIAGVSGLRLKWGI